MAAVVEARVVEEEVVAVVVLVEVVVVMMVVVAVAVTAEVASKAATESHLHACHSLTRADITAAFLNKAP